MATINLIWQPDKDPETKIRYTEHYRVLTPLEKLDFLRDAIWQLENDYNQSLQDFGYELHHVETEKDND